MKDLLCKDVGTTQYVVIAKKDFEILRKFRNLLNYTGKFYESVSILNGKSHDMVRKIKAIGITPKNKKTYPNIIWKDNEKDGSLIFQTLKVLNWLYDGSEDSYRLDRKFQRYLQLKKSMEVENLKGVILAGGSGTRLRPMTLVTNS